MSLHKGMRWSGARCHFSVSLLVTAEKKTSLPASYGVREDVSRLEKVLLGLQVAVLESGLHNEVAKALSVLFCSGYGLSHCG